MITIPPRPCPPVRPEAYTAQYNSINFKKDIGGTASTAAFASWGIGERSNYYAILDENNSVQAALGSFKQGYLQVSTDTTAGVTQNTTVRKNVFHTYGLLGQGPAQDPTATTPAKAFQWHTASATSTHHMMFSILPYDAADAGLTTGQKIEIEATIAAWDYRSGTEW